MTRAAEAAPDPAPAELFRWDAADPDPPAALAPHDSAEGLPISRVQVLPHNIFDPVPGGAFAPVYRLANRLHIRTREKTVRDQLLFRPGDRWSNDIGRETVRNLRALNFLAPSQIVAQRDGDSAVVSVTTRDVWSTSAEFNIESADGKEYGSIAFTESNLAGLGKAFALTYRSIPDSRSFGFSYNDPSVLGSRFRLRYGASDGTSGASDEVGFGVPFYALETPHAYGISWARTTSVVHLYESNAEVVNFNQRIEDAEIHWGQGYRISDTVARWGLNFRDLDRRFGPTQALVSPPEEFVGGEESLRLRRIGVEGRLWHPTYIERTRVNGFGLVEDFDVGHSISLEGGWAPKELGSTDDEGFVQGRLDLGVETPLGFGTLRSSAQTRLQPDPIETLGRLDARWITQWAKSQTLVLAGIGAVSVEAPRNFQLVVGGLNGLRAYPVQAVAGTRGWRLNAENRMVLGENFWESVTVGAVGFMDAARAWGAGSGPSQWFVDAGTGLRIALPQWSLGQVLRIDVAWPLSPTRDGQRDAVLTFGSSQAF